MIYMLFHVKAKKSVAPEVTISYIAADAEASENVRIQRQDEEPDMFYRTTQAEDSNKNKTSGFNKPGTKNALKVAKEALNANYMVICFCLANTPVSILSLFFFGCVQANEGCDLFLVLFRWLIPFKLLAIVPCILVVIYKLKKNNP